MAQKGNPTAFVRSSSSYPASFEAALDQIKAMQETELATPGFNPAAQTIALTRGARTRKAVVWFHGYTNVPCQFKRLAELCYEQGYNALVPCIPHHGYSDRLSGEMSKVKTAELIRFTERMVDLAHGLGEEIVVAGLSMGGVMAAWVAQQRADVKTALIIAPFLGARVIPTALTKTVAYGLRFLPDIQQWWDPELKEKAYGSPYSYLKNSTRSLGQILQMGLRIFEQGRRTPPAAESIWMFINDADRSVNNELNQHLVDLWQKSRPRQVQCFHFPAELGIPHDCISLEQPRGRPELVYAEIMKRL